MTCPATADEIADRIRDEVGPDDPLLLRIAAVMAYKDGTMTASGLRKEAAKGRLVIERVAGKDYTTLGNIKKMREACQPVPKAPDSGGESPGGTSENASHTLASGSSGTDDIRQAQAAATTILQELKGSSPPISPESASQPRRKKAPVIPLQSPSPTS